MPRRGFSPRARGCSQFSPCGGSGYTVFPACAGMFLICNQTHKIQPRFPRVRGDVPSLCATITMVSSFSPRARGCSGLTLSTLRSNRVFPACAGMFPADDVCDIVFEGFPRVRGDVPPVNGVGQVYKGFSPRARGCSALDLESHTPPSVFPACAGMFLPIAWSPPGRPGFPRVRGDVPYCIRESEHIKMFSPRARGCSGRV